MDLEPWSSDLMTLGPRNRKSSLCPFRQSNALLFRNSRENRDHRVFEDTTAIKILLGKTPEPNTIRREAVQVLEGFQDAFTREPVQSPKQKQIQLALTGSLKHRLELRTVALAASLAVNELADDFPTLFRGELPKLYELVFGVLSFVFGRDARIDGDSHFSPRRPSLIRM